MAVRNFSALTDTAVEALAQTAPVAMLVEMGRSAAVLQDMRVLNAMTAAGCFEFRPEMLLNGAAHKSDANLRFAPQEISLVAVWAHVLDGASAASWPYDHTPALPPCDPKQGRTLTPVSDDFRVGFQAALEQFWNSARAHLDPKDEEADEPSLPTPVWDTLLVFGAAAAAMNHRDAAVTIVNALDWLKANTGGFETPPSIARLKPAVLGLNNEMLWTGKAGPDADVTAHYPLRVSPWVLALEFGALDVWEVAQNADRHLRLVTEAAIGRNNVPNDDCDLGHPISAVELMAKGWLGSSPDGWRAMMSRQSYKGVTDEFAKAATELTQLAAHGEHGDWLAAAIDGDLQKYDPRAIVLAASRSPNSRDALQQLRADIPWHDGATAGHFMFEVVRRSSSPVTEPALNVLLDMAAEDGFLDDVIMAPGPHGNRPRSLVECMADEGRVDALVMLLDYGYDPRTPACTGRSLLEHVQAPGFTKLGGYGTVESQNWRIAVQQVLRSWSARLAAQDALESIRLEL